MSQLLEASYSGLQLDPRGSKIDFEFDFAPIKTFEFELKNPSPSDEIKQIELVSNLPTQSYTITENVTSLGPAQTKVMKVEVNSDVLVEFAKKNSGFIPFVSWHYLRIIHLFGG